MRKLLTNLITKNMSCNYDDLLKDVQRLMNAFDYTHDVLNDVVHNIDSIEECTQCCDCDDCIPVPDDTEYIKDLEKAATLRTQTIGFIEGLLDTYAKDAEDVLKEYKEANVPECVKVEALTVYENLRIVLEKVKSELIG